MHENEIDAETGLLTLEKRPGEARILDIACARYMRAGDTILALTDIVAVARDKVTGSAAVSVTVKTHDSAQRVQAKFGAGTDLEDYVVTATFTTVAGDSLAPQVLLRVRS